MLATMLIALGSFLGVMFLIWCLSPRYRQWIERPRHRFQARLRDEEDAARDRNGD